jgi:hypothetical protein
MLERSLEIVCVNAPKKIFGNEWKVIAQQLNLPSGRLDVLLSNESGSIQVVELKKGAANLAALSQVTRYKIDLMASFPGKNVVACILAHAIPSQIRTKAIEMGISCIELPMKSIDEIRQEFGIDDSVLLGKRKIQGILSGGQARKSQTGRVSNNEAYQAMPKCIETNLSTLESSEHFRIYSMIMQTIILYREIKIGGINRKHRGGVAYIASGVVNSEHLANSLFSLGFREMHDGRSHYWYETSWNNCSEIKDAISLTTSNIEEIFNRLNH